MARWVRVQAECGMAGSGRALAEWLVAEAERPNGALCERAGRMAQQLRSGRISEWRGKVFEIRGKYPRLPSSMPSSTLNPQTAADRRQTDGRQTYDPPLAETHLGICPDLPLAL